MKLRDHSEISACWPPSWAGPNPSPDCQSSILKNVRKHHDPNQKPKDFIEMETQRGHDVWHATCALDDLQHLEKFFLILESHKGKRFVEIGELEVDANFNLI